MVIRANDALLAVESSGISECLDRLSAEKRDHRPVSTYRLQFNANFRFTDALDLVPYLRTLGITHCYSSPILKARAGSMHGYDITDHNAINPEIGSEQEFRRLIAALRANHMGFILDVVPNHMGVGYGDNPWWQDVLRNGPSSDYSAFFDIDWNPVKSELRGKVLIPILGNQYGNELERGKICLRFDDAQFFVSYYDHTLPIDPQTIPMIFEALGDFRVHPAAAALSEEARAQVENLLWDLRSLPPHTTTQPELMIKRREQDTELQRRLEGVLATSPTVQSFICAAVEVCNGTPGSPTTFDPLHRLLEAQPYRLAHWRVSAQEINYRRFFDINDLVGLRMEDPRVFAATHKLLRELLAENLVSGLRLDHPDGLLNPVQHYIRTQMLYAASQCCGSQPVPPLADNGIELEVQTVFGTHDWMHEQSPLYLLVEKILEPGEELPMEWPVDGTVGYEFIHLVNGLFIDQRNERAFTNFYHRFIGGPIDFNTLLYESKKLIMATSLSSEVTVLSHILEEVANADRNARDFTRAALTDAIREVIACFPVYRTYIDERGNISDRDRAYITQAVNNAKIRNPRVTASLFDFVSETLLLANPDLTDIENRKRVHFTLKFQQLTAPVMAKGLEDTVCYVYNRFVSLNEVGSSPAHFGTSLRDFHGSNQERAEHWRFNMLASSTHDTKRSEDVRARLNVLSEMPRAWSANVLRWRRMNRSRKRAIPGDRIAPDFNEEYLLYQTLVGAWPMHMNTAEEQKEFAGRIKEYMKKAVLEAKVNLSWVNQDDDYIAALHAFIDGILSGKKTARGANFLAEFQSFISPLFFFGAINSLAQTLLKITSPGVPDTYRGTELWDFSLVDPDNRRTVDYNLRRSMAEQLIARSQDGSPLPQFCDELLQRFDDGRIKLWTIMRALNFRREHASLFQYGAYMPLEPAGENSAHVVSFAREHKGESAITAVPRFAYTLSAGDPTAMIASDWGNTELTVTRASADYENIYTGEVFKSSNSRTLSCREVFAHFPVALLAAR